LRVVFASQLWNAKHAVALLKLYLAEIKAQYLVLLGDIISPNTVLELSREPRLKVMGVTGLYDDVSVATALKDVGGLIEARVVEAGSLKLFGVGLNVKQALMKARELGGSAVDVLASYYPGYKHTCSERGLETVDEIAELLKPKLVVYGKCREPCTSSGVICTSTLTRGYVAVLEANSALNTTIVDLYRHYKLIPETLTPELRQ